MRIWIWVRTRTRTGTSTSQIVQQQRHLALAHTDSSDEATNNARLCHTIFVIVPFRPLCAKHYCKCLNVQIPTNNKSTTHFEALELCRQPRTVATLETTTWPTWHSEHIGQLDYSTTRQFESNLMMIMATSQRRRTEVAANHHHHHRFEK